MEQMIKMTMQHAEWQMARSMGISGAIGTTMPSASYPPLLPPPPPPPPPIQYPAPPYWPYQQRAFSPFSAPAAFPTSVSLPLPTASVPSTNPSLLIAPFISTTSSVSTAPFTSQTLARSSPIALPPEEEDVLADFWNWKFQQTKRVEVRQRLSLAQAICENELWSLEDLKQLSDFSSSIYTHAMKQGMPEGLVRGIHTDIQVFKNVYRTQYKPGQDLLALRNKSQGNQKNRGEEASGAGGFILLI